MPLPPRLDQRLFRHELTPVWLRTAATLAGESDGEAETVGRVAWFGCRALVTPAVVAAVHPSASVLVWDPDPARLTRVAAVGRQASLANLEAHELPSPPKARLVDLFDLVVVDGLVDSTSDAGRDALVTAAACLLRPGGFLAISYRTVVGWGEVAPLVRLLRRTIAEGAAKDQRELLAPLQVLRSRGAAYPAVRPVAGAWLDEVLDMSPAEVVDHWSADDLRPVSHAQISRAVAGHGAEFVTSAHLYDPLTAAPPALARQVRETPTAVLRESLADLAVRRTRRIDLFRLGRSRVDERTRSRSVQSLAMIPTRLDVAGTVGAPWAEPWSAPDGPTTEQAEASGLHTQAGRTVSTRLRDLWPGEPPRRREVLTRAALGAGLLHPVAGPVPDEAAEGAARLTRVLARRGRAEVCQYSVAPAIGAAVPSTYTAELDDDSRRALGIVAQ